MKEKLEITNPITKECPKCTWNTFSKKKLFYLVEADGYETHWECSNCGYKEATEVLL